MKLRTIISLVLVLVMAGSVLAGCGGGGSQQAATTTTPTTTSSTETSEGSTTQVAQKPHIDLTIYHWALNEFDPSKDEVAKIISEKFNVSITPVRFETSDQLKLAAASQSLPDVFDFGVMYDVPTYNNWINQGIVRSIPDELINKFPKTKELNESINTWVAAKELNGAAYHLARSTSTDPTIFKTGWSGVYYRKDWLKNVGLNDVIKTWDEYYQAMKAFKEKDPDQNGVADTSGMTCNTGWMILDTFPAWGADPGGWTYEDGKWIPGYLSSVNIEPLKYWQKLFNEGLIDPEFGNNTAQQAMQKFAGHNFGSIIRNADTYWMWNVIVNQFGNANPQMGDPVELVECSNIFAVDENTPPRFLERADPDGIMFRADLSDEKLERYMEIHEWMYSEEARFLNLGFEGKHYMVGDDGKIVSFNDPETGQPYDIGKLYPATGMLSMISWRFEDNVDPKWPDARIRANIKEKAIANMKERDANPWPANIKLMLVSTPSKDLASGVDYMTEFSLIIMGKEPVEQALAKAQANMLAQGIQPAIDEVNAAAAELGITP